MRKVHYPEPYDGFQATAEVAQDTTPPNGTPLFEVTCVVGTVYSGGTQTPREAAFAMIGRYGGEGVFTFPLEHGGTMEVTVASLQTPA